MGNDMNNNYILFSILRSVLEGTQISEGDRNIFTEEILDSVLKLASRHDIAQIVALGVKRNQLVDKEKEGQLQKIIFQAAIRCEKIKRELNKICQTLEKAEIPFVPLKGSVIRMYYPEPWMRTSCDIDILVREEDLKDAVRFLVNDLKYTANNRIEYHDISLFSQSGVHLELHFSIKENMDNVDCLLSNVWEYAYQEKNGGFCYSLTPEFFVFYHLAHMAHHFVRGGCGIKPFIDMHIIKNRINYDDVAVRNFCRSCGIERFYDNVLYVTNVWLADGEHNVISTGIEDYIFKGGVYGTLENKVTIEQGRQGSKTKYVLSRIFLSYDALKNYYPILKKHKWLFPFVQVIRWFRLAFCGGLDRGAQEMKMNLRISQSQSEKMIDFLEKIGL